MAPAATLAITSSKEVFHFLLSVEDIASSIKAGEGEENDGNEWGI
jgi:hypothetical protein